MSLFNRNLLQRRMEKFAFPVFGGEVEEIVNNWRHMLVSGTLGSMNERNLRGRFMHDFFVKILGYTEGADGGKEWTLKQHQKVDSDQQEADVVIGSFSLVENETQGVIELKSPGTPLDARQSGRIGNYTPVEQGHMYANKIDRCEWVIVSNFEEVRLYHMNRSPRHYELFRISELVSRDKLRRFYYCLCEANLLARGTNKSVARVLLDLSTEQQTKVTKEFYSLFKNTREAVLNHLVANNPGVEPSVLLTKTQKLLDRIVFICFCEDVGLLPGNLLKDTYKQAKSSFYPTGDARIWFHMQGLFEAIDKGRVSADPKINAYNGGLFAEDVVLNSLVVKDDIWNAVVRIADYDFESDLGVNILGHIYEQSLKDIEELKAEFSGKKLFKKNARRKRDGIYYTPEHVTDYIVRRAMDLYLDENPERIKDIKILDMACGSGAFLNQAHSYLEAKWEQAYHEGIVKSEDSELGGMYDYNPVERQRGKLLNHLYGVDLNEESVEITKLGLWLKTARSNEKLQNLDANIKVGNAVIDAPDVAGDKAFDWHEEFPDVMAAGGFDVIVGNPPYINFRNIGNRREKEYYWSRYETAKGQFDVYGVFIERGMRLLKEGGVLGFIVSDTWMSNEVFRGFREWLLRNHELVELVEMPRNTFVDAVVSTVTMFVRKRKPKRDHVIELAGCSKALYSMKDHSLKTETIMRESSRTLSFSPVLSPRRQVVTLGEIASFTKGIVTGNNKRFITRTPIDHDSHPMLRGGDVEPFFHRVPREYIWYRPDVMRENPNAGPRTKELFLPKKILIREISESVQATLADAGLFANNKLFVLHDVDGSYDLAFLTAVLNSSFVSQWFSSRFPGINKRIPHLKQIPVPMIEREGQRTLSLKSKSITRNKTDGYNTIESSLSFLRDHLKFEGTSQRLQRFDKLDWQGFVDELQRHRVRVGGMTLRRQEGLREWFVDKKNQITPHFERVDVLMREIDEIVYELYGLTDGDLEVVKGAVK